MSHHLESIDAVLTFWFGDGQTATQIAAEKTALWWSKDPNTDRQIADRFGATSEAAATGQLADWAKTPRGLLALIICTDQFPRNIHRDTPRAFAYDPTALAFAKTCIDSGAAQQLNPIERTFAYLPFEHSEDLTDQQRSISLYQTLATAAPAAEAELFTGSLDFARRHHEIIQQFGRFPHRNSILGRPSTTAELAFLSTPSSSF